MTTRTITGNTISLIGVATAGQTVTFEKLSTTISGTVITQSGTTTTTTDDGGNFSKALDCPSSGSARWRMIMPNGWDFILDLPYGDGSSVAVTTLISAATVDADAVVLLLDSYVLKSGATMTGDLNFSGTTHAGIKLLSLTTTQRDALTASNGMLIYNSSTGKLNAYQSGAWGEVGGGGASDVTDLTTTTGLPAQRLRVAGAGGLEYRTTEQDLADLQDAGALATTDIGVIVQGYSAKTAAIAALTWAANSIVLLTGTATASAQALATHVITLLQSTDAAAARAAIGVVGGSLDASTQSGVDKTGVSDSTAGLQNAITAAAALGHKTLYLPAGTYSITGASGVLMTLSSDGFKFVGDGAGKTIIKLADSRTLTNHLTLIRLTGVNQAIEGITINCGTGHTVGSYEIDAISIYTPAEYSTVSDVEIYNVAGGTSAGGVGVATYQPYNVNEGYQYAKLTNVVVRDSATATGFIINSNGNILTNCHALDVGNNSSRHGFYQQGGDNLYSGCRGERVGGYSFHMYKMVSNIDASGDKVIGCTSLDPVVGHLVVQGTTNSSNPDVPAGESLARYTIITSNVFKVTGTPPGVSVPVALNAQGVLFTNNVLEDAGGSAAIWVDTISGTDCVVQSNIFRKLNSAITNDTLIRLGVRCIAEGNRAFLNAKSVAAFVRLVGVYAKSSNNCFYGAGGYVQIGANYVESFGDTVILTGSGNAINVSGSLTGAKLRNGHFECTGNTVQLGSVSVTFESCRFVGAVRYDSTGGTVRFINCVGGISYGGFLNQNLDERSGILGAYLNDGNAKTYRRLVTLTGGVLVATGTSDTTFVGIMPTSTGAGAYYFYIVDQPGAVCQVDTDAAWTAGNYGIVSPTVAGKIHDNGASPPASGSYVLFLDTGGSAGVSTVRLVKTL